MRHAGIQRCTLKMHCGCSWEGKKYSSRLYVDTSCQNNAEESDRRERHRQEKMKKKKTDGNKIPVERCLPTILQGARFCTTQRPSSSQYVCSARQASEAHFWNAAKKLHSSCAAWNNPHPTSSTPSFLPHPSRYVPPTNTALAGSVLFYWLPLPLFISRSIPVLTEDILPFWKSDETWLGEGKRLFERNGLDCRLSESPLNQVKQNKEEDTCTSPDLPSPLSSIQNCH